MLKPATRGNATQYFLLSFHNACPSTAELPFCSGYHRPQPTSSILHQGGALQQRERCGSCWNRRAQRVVLPQLLRAEPWVGSGWALISTQDWGAVGAPAVSAPSVWLLCAPVLMKWQWWWYITTSMPVPRHSPILFFSWFCVSLSSQAGYLPCPPRCRSLCQAPSPQTPSPLSGLSFICKAASHTLRPKLPLSFFPLTGCLHPVSHTLCLGTHCKLFIYDDVAVTYLRSSIWHCFIKDQNHCFTFRTISLFRYQFICHLNDNWVQRIWLPSILIWLGINPS